MIWNIFKKKKKKKIKYQLVIGDQICTTFNGREMADLLAKFGGGVVVPVEVEE